MRRWLILLAGFAGSAVAQEGKPVFDRQCAACHAAGGVGTPGLAPPLVNPRLFKGLQENLPRYFVGVLTSGLSGHLEVDGVDYYGLVMPPQSSLTEAEVLVLSSYVLGDLNGAPVALDEAKIRALKNAPLSHAELIKMRNSVP